MPWTRTRLASMCMVCICVTAGLLRLDQAWERLNPYGFRSRCLEPRGLLQRLGQEPPRVRSFVLPQRALGVPLASRR